MKLHLQATALSILLLLLHSCKDADEVPQGNAPGYTPILVAAEPLPPVVRSYLPTGMCDNFKVYAVSEQAGQQTVVMDGYEVRFVSDSWTYESPTQPLMYWSNQADRYLFAAGAPIGAVTSIGASSMTLRLENNTTESVMASEPLKVEQDTPEYGHTVNLRFAYAHCMVKVAFMKNADTDVAITGITLTPDAPITSKANVVVYYNWDNCSYTTQVDAQDHSSAPLHYDNLTIPANTPDVVPSTTQHYCVPDGTNPTGWSVSLSCDGELRSASFENTYTWQGGKCYTYIFSLTEKVPKLVKVTSQDMYFDCNDIVPGGEYSDTDMTE